MDVNAIDGVRTCLRMMVKCQKDTKVTRIGEPFLCDDMFRIFAFISAGATSAYQIAFHKVYIRSQFRVHLVVVV